VNTLKVLISVDAEGMPFVPYRRMLSPGDPLYGELREIMTKVTNIATEALFDSGAKEVIVADSHGSMVNIDPFKLDKRAHLVRGFPRPLMMIWGAERVDAAVFLGYHTCPQKGGVLAHTYAGRIVQRVGVAGEDNVSEYLLNALALGELGRPVILVAGDARLGEQVRKHTPNTVFYQLKESASSLADLSRPWPELEKGLRKAVENAVNLYSIGAIEPLKPEEPWILVELKRPYHADIAELMPCANRLNGVTVRLECERFTDNLKLLEAIVLAAYSLES
jgi:D-amino peptidase